MVYNMSALRTSTVGGSQARCSKANTGVYDRAHEVRADMFDEIAMCEHHTKCDADSSPGKP